jgi:transcriptional regulator NrdR family protein
MLPCPICKGCTIVHNHGNHMNHLVIRRYRKCQKCGHYFKTIEIVQLANFWIGGADKGKSPKEETNEKRTTDCIISNSQSG